MTTSKLYIGIDPGVHGGLACISESGDIIDLQPIYNLSLKEIWAWFTELPEPIKAGSLKAAIEQVPVYVPNRRDKEGNPIGSPGSHMLKLGYSYGVLEAMLVAAGIPYVKVTPHDWQTFHELKRQNMEPTPRYKTRIKKYAASLYPDYKIVSDTGDAALIARYSVYYFSMTENAKRLKGLDYE